MDRLVATVNRRSDAVDAALVAIPPALEVLAGNTAEIRDAVMSIGEVRQPRRQGRHRQRRRHFDEPGQHLAGVAPAGQCRTALDQVDGPAAHVPVAAGRYQEVHPRRRRQPQRHDRPDAGARRQLVSADDRGDGRLTMLETLLGRTVGRQPTPKTRNPLTAPIPRGGAR